MTIIKNILNKLFTVIVALFIFGFIWLCLYLKQEPGPVVNQITTINGVNLYDVIIPGKFHCIIPVPITNNTRSLIIPVTCDFGGMRMLYRQAPAPEMLDSPSI